MTGRRVDPAFLVVAAGVAAALHVGKLPTALPVLREALGVTLVQAGFLLQRGVQPACLLAAGFVAMAMGALVAFSDICGGIPAGVAGAARYAGVLLFSAVGGLIPGTLFSLAVRLAPGESTLSTTVGWMQQWSSIGQFTGPPVVAFVAAAAGGWQWSGVATGICALAGLLLAATIARVPKDRVGTI